MLIISPMPTEILHYLPNIQVRQTHIKIAVIADHVGNLLRSQPARPRRHLERAEEIDGGTLKLAKSRKLSIQTHVFLTGNPLSNVYRIRRGKVYFDRGMTPPVKSVCKTMPSRGRLRPTWGRSALCFFRPTPADLGSNRWRNSGTRTNRWLPARTSTTFSVDITADESLSLL